MGSWPAAVGEGEGAGIVLVVEDDRPTRQLLATIMSEEQLPFHLAATGHEAMSYAANNAVAMVLLDMHLPNLQGEAVATALHIQYGRSLPILAMSASNEEATARRVGAFDFLSKPFDIDELVIKVRRGLAIAANTKRLREKAGQATNSVKQTVNRQRQAFERHRVEDADIAPAPARDVAFGP